MITKEQLNKVLDKTIEMERERIKKGVKRLLGVEERKPKGLLKSIETIIAMRLKTPRLFTMVILYLNSIYPGEYIYNI